MLHHELKKVLDNGGDDLTVAQFNCNNGREVISAVQLGFVRGFRFDFSKEFVKQATDYAATSRVNCKFVRSDIYKIDERYFKTSDALFLTAGAMCWMPDLDSYFAKAANILKPGGRLVLWETHPYLEMFKPDRDRIRDNDTKLSMHYPYFLEEPVILDLGLDYYSNEIDGEHNLPYWYHHTLSYIIQSIIDNGFEIEVFSEHDFDNSIGYRHVEAFAVRPPMSFIISAVKQA